jgi:hypothetical protein
VEEEPGTAHPAEPSSTGAPSRATRGGVLPCRARAVNQPARRS